MELLRVKLVAAPPESVQESVLHWPALIVAAVAVKVEMTGACRAATVRGTQGLVAALLLASPEYTARQ